MDSVKYFFDDNEVVDLRDEVALRYQEAEDAFLRLTNVPVVDQCVEDIRDLSFTAWEIDQYVHQSLQYISEETYNRLTDVIEDIDFQRGNIRKLKINIDLILENGGDTENGGNPEPLPLRPIDPPSGHALRVLPPALDRSSKQVSRILAA